MRNDALPQESACHEKMNRSAPGKGRKPVAWMIFLFGLLLPGLTIGLDGATAESGSDRSISIGMSKHADTLPREILSELEFDPVESAGLFVGINEFSDPRILPLKYAVDDAVDQAYRFWELGLIKPARIHLGLAGKPAKDLSKLRLEELRRAKVVEFLPTGNLLLGHLDSVAGAAGKRGILVITFSTHGYYLNGDELIAQDTQLSLRSDAKILKRTSLSHQDIITLMQNNVICPRKLVLIDACREHIAKEDGTRSLASSSPLPESLRELLENSKGMAVLLATSTSGFGYDGGQEPGGSEIKNGVFSHYLLKGLDGAAKHDERGVITIWTLAQYIDEQTREWVRHNRSDHIDKSLGIEKRFDGPSEAIPLAVSQSGHEKYRKVLQRRDKALEMFRVLRENNIVLDMVGREVVQALKSPEPGQLEGLIERIEWLDTKSYTPGEFVDWWRMRKPAETTTRVSIVPAPPQAAQAHRHAGTTWEDWFFEPISWVVLLLILFLLAILLYLVLFRKRVSRGGGIDVVTPASGVACAVPATVSPPLPRPSVPPTHTPLAPSSFLPSAAPAGSDLEEDLRRILNALAERPRSFECRLLVQLHTPALRGPSDAGPLMRGFISLQRHTQCRSHIGDRLQFVFQASEDCYLTLVDFGTSGRVTIIYPNWHQRGGRIPAHQPLLIPPVTGGSFDYVISPPAGEEVVMALATRQPIDAFSPHQWAELEQSIIYQPDRQSLYRDIQVVKKSFSPGGGAIGWSLSSCRIEIAGH